MIKNIGTIAVYFLCCFCTEGDSQNIKEVTILHWNDFHSFNLPYRVTKKDTDSTYYVGGTGSMMAYLKNTEQKIVYC